jgi:hypothetical protein
MTYLCVITNAAKRHRVKFCSATLYRGACTQKAQDEWTVFCFIALFPRINI